MTDNPQIDAELERAITAVVDHLAGDTGPVVVTDWAIMVAAVRPAEAGEQTGYWYLPRPHQPLHSTIGLFDFGHRWALDDAVREDD